MSDQISVTINGEQHRLPDQLNLVEVLAHLEIEGRLAIDLNGEIIPRSQHAETLIKESDRLEIVHAIGGG